MKKNKLLAVITAIILCVGMLTGCGETAPDTGAEKGAEKVKIVCTTVPQYDWAREIIGENTEQFELTLLLDRGVDLHSYQPTAEDIARIGLADIFIYVGGESEAWVEDALKEAANEDMKVINLLDTLGGAVKEEEIVPGMQAEHDHEEEEEGEEGHHHEGEAEYDEHVWLSLKNAEIFVEAIAGTIQIAEPENAERYLENSKAYGEQLDQLDQQYRQVVQSARFDTVLFGDRFPFRYLTDDYDINYYAAFAGCSAETEASFETITFLSEKIDELELGSILVIESSDQKIAETINQNTDNKDKKILVMNSLQSVTGTDIKNGFTYIKAMQDNLEVLKAALN